MHGGCMFCAAQSERTKDKVRERGPVISADDDTSRERGSWRRRVSGHLRTLTSAGACVQYSQVWPRDSEP